MKVVVLYKLPPKPKAWDRLVLAIVEHGRRVERPVSQGEVVELADVGRRERSLLELGHIAEMQDPDYSKTGVDPSEVARILAGPSGGARVETIAIAPEGELDAPPSTFGTSWISRESLPGVSEPVDEVHRIEIDDVTGEVIVNRPLPGGDLPIDPPAMLFETLPGTEPIGIPTSAHPATVDSDPPQKRRRPGRPKGSRNKPKA